ncbi:MAG: LysR family transcriptional regulator [Polyangiaceae bacterium]
MFTWDDLKVFLAIHREGSLARASKALDIDATTAGRRLTALETDLDAKLFSRVGNTLSVTPTGARLLERALTIENEILACERETRGQSSKLEGKVSITSGEALAAWVLTPALPELFRSHPALTVELRPDNRALDLARREADIAIRLFRPREATLVASRAGAQPFGVFASDSYLAQHPPLKRQSDLALHDWVAWEAWMRGTPQEKFRLAHAPRARVVLRTSSTIALVSACAAGLGLAVLPVFAAQHEPTLVRVLPRVGPTARDVWIVTHEDSRSNAKIKAVLAWLHDTLSRSSAIEANSPSLAR